MNYNIAKDDPGSWLDPDRRVWGQAHPIYDGSILRSQVNHHRNALRTQLKPCVKA